LLLLPCDCIDVVLDIPPGGLCLDADGDKYSGLGPRLGENGERGVLLGSLDLGRDHSVVGVEVEVLLSKGWESPKRV
jgi:hypothetical protein